VAVLSLNTLWTTVDYPITPAVRYLRDVKASFVPRLYNYVEKGGTAESARQLGVDEHAVVKTLVFETNDKKPLIMLMHGDRHVSTKNLARCVGAKSIEPATPDRAAKWTGYLVGGTSPFGTRTRMPVYAESTIFDLDRIFINGGKRGFLIEISPDVLREHLAAEPVEVAI
jgi:Cys-tRNA(Pro) deacylase